MKNSFKIAAVFIGTFVGAGFASGQEILQYFAVYGKAGIAGAVISSAMFGFFCYCTLYNLLTMGESLYLKEVNRFAFFKYLYVAFMVMMFCTMITAAGETVKSIVGVPKIYGVAITLILCAFILYFGSDGMVKLNVFITPLIIAGIIIICIINIYESTVSTMAGAEVSKSAVIYVSYNTITLSSMAAGLGKMVSDKKTALKASAVSAFSIFLLIICMLYVLYGVTYTSSEVPVLDALSDKFSLIYIPVLISAMVTTAVSNGYGVMCNFKKNKIACLACLCLISLVFSIFRFSFIVRYFYKFFGYIGIFVMLDNFYIFIKNKKFGVKRRKTVK